MGMGMEMEQVKQNVSLPQGQTQEQAAFYSFHPQLAATGATLAEVAHEARNMVAALVLYCDLLEEPGVLAQPYQHYGSELKMVATTSQRLLHRMMSLLGEDSLDAVANLRPAAEAAPD